MTTVQPSAPQLDNINAHVTDDDVVAVFDDPEFLKKMVDMFDPKAKRLYEDELQHKANKRLQDEQSEKAERENRRLNWQRSHDNEISWMLTILKYVWLVYLAIACNFFLIHFLGDYVISTFGSIMHVNGIEFVKFLSSQPLSEIFGMAGLFGIPFLVVSVFVALMFTDM